ncbi:sensor histidine kinase [Marinomonas primoryensis]|uniref:histidine kinase n=1 Tax=Marinomonas primoryensis TaxID=178399 RepID=A0A859D0N0_9GAMM|nr:ATP-binding protein [Marinomonas primoryensis]QKK80340.1 signal transduction histidine kinase [Marinomonas primoryensis]
MSLRLKTIIGIAAIEALLLVLLVTTTLDYLRSTNYETLTKRASSTATLFATTTKNAVLSYDLASLDAFVKDVLVNPDLVYARVIGTDGNLFAEAVEKDYISFPFFPDKRVEDVADGVFDTFANILEGGVIYGRVEIGLDINSISAKIKEAENRSIIIAIVEMGLVALFSFLLGGFLTGQLKVLSAAAKSISAGNLDIKLPIKGQDEIADVANAFNIMAFNLKDASARRDQFEAKLTELNRSLEDRVETRTKQIEIKNTELEKANSDIKKAQTKLLKAEKMASLGVLVAGVAHEINNPIGFVMSNLHSLIEYGQNYRSLIAEYALLLKFTDSEAKKEQQDKINHLCMQYDLEFMNEDIDILLHESIEGTERIRDIVQGLKNYIFTPTHIDYAMNDLNECIQSALAIVREHLPEQVKIKTDLAILQPILCCKTKIKESFLNLIMNAKQAIVGEGMISIKSRQKGEWLEIEVSDNGMGIPIDHLDKIFDPFFTTRPVGNGIGLGLTIADGIMREHGGDIRVKSELNQGSLFTMRIPIKRDLKVVDY